MKRLLKVPSDEQPTAKRTSVTLIYRGGLVLAAVLHWLTDVGDTS